MKFHKLEHDFGQFAARWRKDTAYVLFGASPACRDLLQFSETFLGFKIKAKCIVDFDTAIHGNHISLASLGRGMSQKTDGEFEVACPSILERERVQVIITSDVYRAEAIQFLQGLGYVHWKDFCTYRDIVGIWSLVFGGETVLWRSDLLLTPKCTLRCRNCNMYMTHYKKTTSTPLVEHIQDISAYFDAIDKVCVFHLVGGEPLLYPQLAELITHIGEKHSKQIGRLLLTTNGTVKPSEEVLEAMSTYGVMVNISNYTNEIDYGARLQEVLGLFTRYGVAHDVMESLEWVDFGNPLHNLGLNDEELLAHYNRCTATYRGIHDKRLYYCNINFSAVAAGLFPDDENNYIELSTAEPDEIVEFDLGFPRLGYVTFCNHCNGCHTGRGEVVRAAIQAPRGSVQ